MAKIKGFPEWLPSGQLVQEELVRILADGFELYGFSPLRTRSIEPLEELFHHGETDKEIFGVAHLGVEREPAWGLHYDLTVPFARYVSENIGQISFPYRRYQIQQCWRGERPQKGRFREFIQADADIVDQGELALRHDADLLIMFADQLSRLPIPKCTILVNNRKLLEGFYRGLGVSDVVVALRAIDKLPKIGRDAVVEELGGLGLSDQGAQAAIELCDIKASTGSDLERVRDFGVSHDLLDQGISELTEVLDRVGDANPRTEVIAGLHIARGFAYYTGTVAEAFINGHEALGSVCSGGRYENLIAGQKTKYPGVGFSIGVSRLLSACFDQEFVETDRVSTVEVLVAVNSESSRSESESVARQLRERGVKALTSDSDAPFGKQIKLAERQGIRYVWFYDPQTDSHEVRDLNKRDQSGARPDIWIPGG